MMDEESFIGRAGCIGSSWCHAGRSWPAVRIIWNTVFPIGGSRTGIVCLSYLYLVLATEAVPDMATDLAPDLVPGLAPDLVPGLVPD